MDELDSRSLDVSVASSMTIRTLDGLLDPGGFGWEPSLYLLKHTPPSWSTAPIGSPRCSMRMVPFDALPMVGPMAGCLGSEDGTEPLVVLTFMLDGDDEIIDALTNATGIDVELVRVENSARFSIVRCKPLGRIASMSCSGSIQRTTDRIGRRSVDGA